MMGVVLPEPLGAAALRAATEEWLVACTIATEVPPSPCTRIGFAPWTLAAIPLAIRAVAEVIETRTKTPGFQPDALSAVLAPKQFSAVMRGLRADALGHRDIWLDAVAGRWFPDHVGRCLAEWRRVLRTDARIAGGATHYFSPVGMLPAGSKPQWSTIMKPVPVAGIPTDWFSFFR